MSEYKYKLPDVGEGVVEAEIVEWHIKEGDKVTEDQHILDVMTDKATVEIPCAVNGVVKKIVGSPGDVLPVGTEILVIEIDGSPPTEEEAPAPAPEVKEEKKPAADPEKGKALAEGPDRTADKSEDLAGGKQAVPPAKPAAPAPKAAAAPARASGERPMASPAVRQRALDADIDLSAVPGTGPAGRITHADMDDFIASGGRLASKAGGSASGPSRAPRTGVKEEKVIGLRRKIAQNMAAAKRTIPHITYVDEIDLTALEDLRAHLNATRKDGLPKLTLIPFLVAAMTRALPQFPQANAHFDTEESVLTKYEGVHCGIATATPNGLMVPVIRHAEALDIWQIADEVKRLADACRDGKATKEELSGSTITITSLGAIGGLVSTPVINLPETAIIGVNKMQVLPRYDDGGRLVPRKIMNLSSSFDHRIVDGYEAALLVQAIKGYLENPATLFM
ncbi:branched-chain alpha-keto acid dehydrogenase subunit E2 [Glycocaulis alkaliphilus]|uniref:Dihydrolipoamide acetyltransferase component of pyruvate dehydrogenase complex n=1 Tax=Glycocaulis alkaliphilus TaxID=1434191 RepID=A0A3T0E7W4_9PROT|nr:dihydrolipoamide acetyltransferase family protein [Glycocaulis alkaliphilus]AZU03473.1 branched-chain alpha-keto acid dehydrogenase subunit E2 [Glycocaulis alkaliphilus]GGB73765.1 lipoamide acyltransferase component of branched-chain alpha-keto acid dehydrogenase complex [Glycocaulis alkaliphilus]